MLGLVLNAGPNFALKCKQQIFPRILSLTREYLANAIRSHIKQCNFVHMALYF